MTKNISVPFIFKLFKATPFLLLYGISNVIYFILRFIFPYRKKIIEKNIRNSFPNKSDQEIKNLRNKYYRHLADILVESLKMWGLSDQELLERMKVKNPEVLEKLYLEKKSLIGIGAHYCNWEWGSLILPLITKHHCFGVYKPLSNKKLDTFMKALRTQKGMQLIAMKDIIREIIRKKSEPTFTILIADQSPMKDEIQHWETFLNQSTAVYLGPEKISRSTGYPLYYIHIDKIKRGYYEIEFLLISDNPKEENDLELTSKHVKILEKQILDHPENWLWSHNRWKHSPRN